MVVAGEFALRNMPSPPIRADTHTLSMPATIQVVDFGFESGVIDLLVGEASVGSIALTFMDPKTNSPKTEGGGATKPSVIQRHLTTQVSE